jgi:hypothetical protein
MEAGNAGLPCATLSRNSLPSDASAQASPRRPRSGHALSGGPLLGADLSAHPVSRPVIWPSPEPGDPLAEQSGDALELARAGWSMVMAGRRTDALEETAALAREGVPVLAVRTDVTRPEDVDALFRAVREQFGRLDLLFDNAGIFGPSVPRSRWRI